MDSKLSNPLAAPVRRYPHHAPIDPHKENAFIFLTVCTKFRAPLLANHRVHLTLREIWSDSSQWRVGPYVLMKDHLHLIAAMSSSNAVRLESWISWWKRLSSRKCKEIGLTWQKGFWDVRIRNDAALAAKCLYMRDNPLRKGLVATADEWPFTGVVHKL